MKVTVITCRGYSFEGEITKEALDIAWRMGRLTLDVIGGCTVDIFAIDHIVIAATGEVAA
jgi:hypothetical protein